DNGAPSGGIDQYTALPAPPLGRRGHHALYRPRFPANFPSPPAAAAPEKLLAPSLSRVGGYARHAPGQLDHRLVANHPVVVGPSVSPFQVCCQEYTAGQPP